MEGPRRRLTGACKTCKVMCNGSQWEGAQRPTHGRLGTSTGAVPQSNTVNRSRQRTSACGSNRAQRLFFMTRAKNGFYIF